MKSLKKYSFLIGFFLLIFVIYRLNLETLLLAFKKINYPLLILGLLLTPFVILIKSWRWNYLKKNQDINYRLTDSILMYSVAAAIGLLTPGRIGEVSKIAYLKNDRCSTGQSLVSVVMDRLLDLFFLMFFGYLGIIFFFGFFEKITLIYSIIIFSIIGLVFIIKKRLYYKLIKRIFAIIIPLKYQKSWQTNFSDFLNGIKIYNKKVYFYSLFITLLAWLIYYLQIYLFAKSIWLIKVPFLYLAIAVTVSGFISLLPISFLGIGTRETTLMLLLSPLAINPERIILLSELILLDFLVVGVIGVISWIFKPLPLAQIFSTKTTIKS